MIDDDDHADDDHADGVDVDAAHDVDDAFDDIVPAGFAAVVPKRFEPERLRPHSFEALRHRAVVVRANGFVYRGVFAGCDEAELYLKGELRWWVLPLDTVTAVAIDVERDDDDVGP